MSLRVGEPQYGGTFQVVAEPGEPTSPAVQPMRFVLSGERIAEPSALPDAGAASLAILEPSPARVIPECRHFGVCGGCDYQHAGYPAQIEIKRTILVQTIQAAGVAVDVPLTAHPSSPWQYRNRVRMRVEMVDGQPRAGYNRRGTRIFLPITECPIAAPLLWRAAETLTRLPQTSSIAAAWLNAIAEVEFQADAEETALQMTVFTRDRRVDGFGEFCGALATGLPQLTGAGVLGVNAGFGAKERASWGKPGLVHNVLGQHFWVTRGAFFQVNRSLLPELAALVTGGRSGMLAWDLFAGVGLFARLLAACFENVVAVESAPLAAGDLARSGQKNLRAVRAETVGFLRAAVLQREHPDLIVMDPPRAGLGPEVCGLVARVGARRLVYVSCDPVTLARDLKMLVDSGYRIEALHLLDMFPQTFHLETVVFLEKQPSTL